MGGTASTRRVTFEADENENITVVKGIRLSENVIDRMKETSPSGPKSQRYSGAYGASVRGPLTVVASPVAEHRLRMHRLSGRGSRAQPLHGMWDLPRPGHEPVSPASAGGLSTTAPPGKPYTYFLIVNSQ